MFKSFSNQKGEGNDASEAFDEYSVPTVLSPQREE
ncbi:unnamed protein product [Prunus brigantina]